MKFKILFSSILLSLSIVQNFASAQQIEMLPVLQWKYQPDGIIDQFAMSSNHQYFIVIVSKENNWVEDREMHLLDKDGKLKWKLNIDTNNIGLIKSISLSDKGDIIFNTKLGIPFIVSSHIYFINNSGEIEFHSQYNFKKGEDTIQYSFISPDGRFICFNGASGRGDDYKGFINLSNINKQIIFKKSSNVYDEDALDYRGVPPRTLISRNASYLINQGYYKGNPVVSLFDKTGKLLWIKRSSRENKPFDMSPNGEYIGIISEDDDGSKTFTLFHQGKEIFSRPLLLMCGEDWYDYSISSKGELVFVLESTFGEPFCEFYTSEGKSEGKTYVFDIPRGRKERFFYTTISADGQIIALSTGYEIHCIQKLKLKK